MALDKSGLQAALEDWMNAGAETVADMASAVTDAYDTYALDAEGPTGQAPLLTMKSAMEAILAALPSTGTAASAALVFANSITAYWTLATFVVGPGEVSEIVTTPPVPAILAAAITTVFSDTDPETTVAEKSSDIADAMDTATKTTIVTVVLSAGPPPTVGTIS